MTTRPSERLPDFPWDLLAPYGARADAHPGGRVDLSVGTPVDPTPPRIVEALAAAADAPGYPTTAGTPALRTAIAGWMKRRLAADVAPDAVLPTIGSKELIALLPMLLGLGPSDHIVIPRTAYPTYAVGAALVGAQVTATDTPEQVSDAALIWLNSPSNPTGRVLPAERLAQIVEHARSTGAIVASDECYIELGWDADPVSVLDPRVCAGSHTGLLAVHSLSKRSSMAGHRFGFVAGDPALVGSLLAVRKHLGFMVPTPVQAAAITALDDDGHVEAVRARYGRRRAALRSALEAVGFTIDDSEAGLYLWATRGEPCWQTVEWFAERGILVTPGEFYGDDEHVRIALTVTDERLDAAISRLARA